MSKVRLAAFLLTTGLAGCSWQGPSLAGYPGLQYQVTSLYGDRAMEQNASCPNPRMWSVTKYTVVEDTPERVVMDIHYYWVDESQSIDVQGSSMTTCRDWGDRTFTFAKTTGGGLEVVSMTGAQKRA